MSSGPVDRIDGVRFRHTFFGYAKGGWNWNFQPKENRRPRRGLCTGNSNPAIRGARCDVTRRRDDTNDVIIRDITNDVTIRRDVTMRSSTSAKSGPQNGIQYSFNFEPVRTRRAIGLGGIVSNKLEISRDTAICTINLGYNRIFFPICLKSDIAMNFDHLEQRIECTRNPTYPCPLYPTSTVFHSIVALLNNQRRTIQQPRPIALPDLNALRILGSSKLDTQWET